MAATVVGILDWGLERDEEGQRTYTLDTLVQTEYDDGPACIIGAAGLPMVGSSWNYGGGYDAWAYCTPKLSVRYHERLRYEQHDLWIASQTFATGSASRGRCQDTNIEDPLLEPPKMSGTFNPNQHETKVDRYGNQIKSSSHEQVTGVMKDDTRPSVVIEWNSMVLDLAWMAEAMNTLNDGPMWGLPARRIKLSSGSWARNMYGLCNYYFTKHLEFEVRYEGFDSEFASDRIMDTGFQCLDGIWEEAGTAGYPMTWLQNPFANEDRLEDFIRVRDYTGEPSPMRVPLDGHGGRLTDPANPEFLAKVELYDETNFLAYGIPAVLG